MTENLFTPSSIRVFPGIYVNPLEMTEAQICIESIAHSLAQQARWVGHAQVQYSVAQHSVKVSTYFTRPRQALAGLLHDAAEAYLGDVARPLKNDVLLQYKPIEERIMGLVMKRFNLTEDDFKDVSQADDMELENEWDNIVLAYNWRPHVWGWEEAKRRFLERYQVLTEAIDLIFGSKGGITLVLWIGYGLYKIDSL